MVYYVVVFAKVFPLHAFFIHDKYGIGLSIFSLINLLYSDCFDSRDTKENVVRCLFV